MHLGKWVWVSLPERVLEGMADDPQPKVRESVRLALGRDPDGGHVWEGAAGDMWCRWCSASRDASSGWPCPRPDGVPFGA